MALLEENKELQQDHEEAVAVATEAKTEESSYQNGRISRAWDRHGDKVAAQYVAAGVGEEFNLIVRDARGIEKADPAALKAAQEKVAEAGLTADPRTAMRGWLQHNSAWAQRREALTKSLLENNQERLETIDKRLGEINTQLDAFEKETQANAAERERLVTEQAELTKRRELLTKYNEAIGSPEYYQKLRQEARNNGRDWQAAVTCVENEYLGVCAAPPRTSAANADGNGIEGLSMSTAFNGAVNATGPVPDQTAAPLAPTPERRPVMTSAAPAP